MIREAQQPIEPAFGYTNLLINLRNLWLDLATWSRNYMESTLSGFGNVNKVGERLYRIPLDFYSRLQLIFGAQNAQGFLNLLSQHIVLMMETASALKRGDINTVNSNTAKMYQNSADLANYMVQLNPYWTEVQWRTLMDQYVNLTLQELVSLAAGNYDQDIDIYDRIVYFTVFLADYMTEGIVSYLTFRNDQHSPITPQVPQPAPAPVMPQVPLAPQVPQPTRSRL